MTTRKTLMRVEMYMVDKKTIDGDVSNCHVAAIIVFYYLIYRNQRITRQFTFNAPGINGWSQVWCS